MAGLSICRHGIKAWIQEGGNGCEGLMDASYSCGRPLPIVDWWPVPQDCHLWISQVHGVAYTLLHELAGYSLCLCKSLTVLSLQWQLSAQGPP
jgi:hypothetical protein